MTLESIITIAVSVCSIILTIIAWPIVQLVRGVMTRIDMLERDIKTKIDETEVRALLKDNLNPIKEDLVEIKQTQQTILNHLISKKY